MSQETFTFLTIMKEEQRGMRISIQLFLHHPTHHQKDFFCVWCSLSFEHDSCGAPEMCSGRGGRTTID